MAAIGIFSSLTLWIAIRWIWGGSHHPSCRSFTISQFSHFGINFSYVDASSLPEHQNSGCTEIKYDV